MFQQKEGTTGRWTRNISMEPQAVSISKLGKSPLQVDKWKAKAEALDEVGLMVGVWRVQ